VEEETRSYVVDCHWPDGDLNHRTIKYTKARAEKLAAELNAAPHCSLPHTVRKI